MSWDKLRLVSEGKFWSVSKALGWLLSTQLKKL